MTYDRLTYNYYKEHGICVKCHRRDAALTHVLCDECAPKVRRYEQHIDPSKLNEKRDKRMERYYYRKAAGLCVQCGKRKAYNGGVFCMDCTLRRRRRRAPILAARKKKTNFSEGLCMLCNEPALPGKKLCERHYKVRAANIEKARAHRPSREHFPWVKDNVRAFMKRKA